MTYRTEIAAGCYSGATAPVTGEHATLAAALEAARKSDRIVAVGPDGARCQIPQQNHPRLGAGRYGRGITRAAARKLGWPL